MAKDNRTIRSAVRIGDEVYGDGREDELESVLTKEQLQRLTDEGALEGDWSAKGKATPAAAESTETAPKAKSGGGK